MSRGQNRPRRRHERRRPSTSTLSAKYRTSSFDADLSNGTLVDNEASGAGTTTEPPIVDLVLDSGGTGSGTGTVAFTSFDYCQ